MACRQAWQKRCQMSAGSCSTPPFFSVVQGACFSRPVRNYPAVQVKDDHADALRTAVNPDN